MLGDNFILFKHADGTPETACIRVILDAQGLTYLGQEGLALQVAAEHGALHELKTSREDAGARLARRGLASIALALLEEPKTQMVRRPRDPTRGARVDARARGAPRRRCAPATRPSLALAGRRRPAPRSPHPPPRADQRRATRAADRAAARGPPRSAAFMRARPRPGQARPLRMGLLTGGA